MKRINIIAILTAVILSFGLTAQAAPSNDGFSSAMPLVVQNGSASFITNNVGATKETGEPNHAENAGGKSVWFSFTPTATTVVRINLVDTTLDTLLGVYTGTNVNNLTLVGYNDDCNTSCGQASTVDLMVVAGTTYYIAVDGFNDSGTISTGNFKIVILDNGTPFQDNLQGTYDLGFSARGSIAGTNHNATIEANEPASYTSLPSNGKSVWYKWTATANFSMAFELTENFDSQIGIYTANVSSPTFAQLTKIKSNIDNIHFSDSKYRATFFAENGKTYFIKVEFHTFASNTIETGNFQLKFYPNRLRYSTKLSGITQKTSLALYRPSNGTWYNLPTLNSSPYYLNFGLATDTPIAADFAGDGLSRIAVVRDENGKKVWYFSNGGTAFSTIQWGLSTDKPATGDFDLDGRADLVAIRNSGQNLVWYVRQSSNGGLRTFTFGIPTDKPVFGDFDGDGGTDVAVIRNTQNGWVWHILKSNGTNYNQYESMQFGTAPDIPAVEDFDGDGRTDIAVFRPSNGTWYILRSSTNQLQATPFGTSGDKPQPADYDGDGKADLVVFRPNEGNWYLWLSGTDSQKIINWGTNGDIPISSMNTLSQ